jgi:alkanesulfonate monooxygenase SsuD/methylene tetrahydromethanopterin reductase-like flavin-dependent oxidoreductase (luciferase family)
MTEKLRLVHLVLGNTYRNPALVAKMVAKMAPTIDQADFPSMKERQDRLQEACELIRKLFTADGPVDYDGRYYRLDQAQLSPGCHQRPHIPIMVGGTGERRTLRTLARHGDVFNLDGWAGGGMSLEYYQHKIRVLERHCEDLGRDPAEIRRTLLMPLNVTDDRASAKRFIEALGPGSVAGPRSYVIERIGEFADAGVEEIMFGAIRTGDVEGYQRVEEEIVAAFD